VQSLAHSRRSHLRKHVQRRNILQGEDDAYEDDERGLGAGWSSADNPSPWAGNKGTHVDEDSEVMEVLAEGAMAKKVRVSMGPEVLTRNQLHRNYRNRARHHLPGSGVAFDGDISRTTLPANMAQPMLAPTWNQKFIARNQKHRGGISPVFQAPSEVQHQQEEPSFIFQKTEQEIQLVFEALQPTREAYEIFAGVAPPPTNVRYCYAMQYYQLQRCLQNHFRHCVGREAPSLPLLSPWMGGLEQWRYGLPREERDVTQGQRLANVQYQQAAEPVFIDWTL